MFQHLVESVPRRIKTVLKTKGVQPGPSKMYLIKWPVSVYIHYVCVCVNIYIYILNYYVIITKKCLGHISPKLH